MTGLEGPKGDKGEPGPSGLIGLSGPKGNFFAFALIYKLQMLFKVNVDWLATEVYQGH